MKGDVERLVEQIARGTDKLLAKHASRHEDDEDPEILATEQAQSLSGRGTKAVRVQV